MSPLKDTEMHEIKTDVALIKQNQENMRKDMNQIGEIFMKVENTMNKLTDAITTIAVQEKILENTERRLAIVESDRANQILASNDLKNDLRSVIEKIKEEIKHERELNNKHLMDKLEEIAISSNDQDKRLSSLEGWRYYVIGAVVAITAVVKLVPWDKFL